MIYTSVYICNHVVVLRMRMRVPRYRVSDSNQTSIAGHAHLVSDINRLARVSEWFLQNPGDSREMRVSCKVCQWMW